MKNLNFHFCLEIILLENKVFLSEILKNWLGDSQFKEPWYTHTDTHIYIYTYT